MSSVSSVSFPVSRPAGQALVVGAAGSRMGPVEALGRLGFACTEMDDPYAGVAMLCREPRAYRALILSLQGLYPEELELIPVVKRRFPQVEVWLSDTDGRQAAVAEAMRLGADGLVSENGLHRIGVAPPMMPAAPTPSAAAAAARRPTSLGGLAANLSAAAEDLAATSGVARSGAAHRPPARSGMRRSSGGRPVPVRNRGPVGDDALMGEAVLTAEELRALLQEEPSAPPPHKGLG